MPNTVPSVAFPSEGAEVLWLSVSSKKIREEASNSRVNPDALRAAAQLAGGEHNVASATL